MINLFHKVNRYRLGAVTLIFAIILIVLCTLIIIFAANFGRMQDLTVANQTRNAQSFEAAEAGQEFAINYLRQNADTIIASPSGGFINYSNGSTTNVALANGASFSVVYTNPIANDYTLLEITSTGVNSDNTSTRIIKQQVKLGSLLLTSPTSSLITKGSVIMGGSTTIVNTGTNSTVVSGSTVSMSGSANTVTSSGTSTTPSNPGSGIQQNVSSIGSLSDADFFANFFGTTNISSIQAQFNNVYTNSSSTNYSSTLNGITGASIWINQTGGSTATINGNTTIGSLSAPVLLVVSGPLSISGNVTIYGFIYVIGPSGITTLTGNINIIGGLASTDNLNFGGNSSLAYNNNVLNSIRNNPNMRYYAKVPGSWKDY